MLKLSGKPAYKGIAIGPVVVLKPHGQQIKRTKIENIEAEISRFAKAGEKAAEQLVKLYDKAVGEVGEASAAIFEVHKMMLEDEDYLEAAAGCPVEAVRGNNDYFSPLPQEQIIEIAGKRIFMTHGHYYYVVAGLEHLIREAKGRDVDIVMFGHIHRPVIRQEGALTVINPGSLSFPRQEDRKPSYIVMETDAQKGFQYFLKFF